jgi:hypothetical protein
MLVWAALRVYVAGKPLMGDTPYIGTTITPSGMFGVPVVVGGPAPRLISTPVHLAILMTGALAAALLIPRVLARMRAELLKGPVPLFTLLHVPVLLVASFMFDRYLMVLFPGFLYLAISRSESTRLCWPAGFAALMVSGLLSLGLIHDWLAWNSARWELGRRALANGIKPEEIEGGFEWDGWYSPTPAQRRFDLPPQGLVLPLFRPSFPHITGRYALAFKQPPDTIILDRQPYLLWLSPQWREFLLVELVPSEPKSDSVE